MALKNQHPGIFGPTKCWGPLISLKGKKVIRPFKFKQKVVGRKQDLHYFSTEMPESYKKTITKIKMKQNKTLIKGSPFLAPESMVPIPNGRRSSQSLQDPALDDWPPSFSGSTSPFVIGRGSFAILELPRESLIWNDAPRWEASNLVSLGGLIFATSFMMNLATSMPKASYEDRDSDKEPTPEPCSWSTPPNDCSEH